MKLWRTFHYWKSDAKIILGGLLGYFKRGSKRGSMTKDAWDGYTRTTDSTQPFHHVRRLWKQSGSQHYKEGGIQPLEYILANSLDFCEGNVIKYITRWRKKGTPLEDLKKVRHYTDVLIEEWQLGNNRM